MHSDGHWAAADAVDLLVSSTNLRAFTVDSFYVTVELLPTMLKLSDSLFLIWLIPYASVAYKKYVFDVSMQYKSPDCVERPVTLINGRFPGPTINVTAGELLEVEVRHFFLVFQTFLVTLCILSMQINIIYENNKAM